MTAALQLPAGFRFHPTDDELVTHYLCRKCASEPIAVPIIREIDLYKHNPWDLPDLALYGEKEWYFFSPRDRKYPNGSRPNRAAGSGFWKATGADKPVGKPKMMGIKKALVFYSGKAPKGEKTNWIMHEYRLADVDRSARKNHSSLRLDDWVLCRIYNKKGAIQRQPSPENKPSLSAITEEEKKPEIAPSGIYTNETSNSVPSANDYNFDLPGSVPKMHTDYSSCSEHVLSPEFTTSEVQSVPNWNDYNNALDFPYNYMGASTDMFQMSPPLQDLFMYLQNPF